MKEVYDYINSLSIDTLVQVYKDEYLVFKKTGICPDGVIRNIAIMCNKIINDYNINFAERLFLNRCAEEFYIQNQ